MKINWSTVIGFVIAGLILAIARPYVMGALPFGDKSGDSFSDDDIV